MPTGTGKCKNCQIFQLDYQTGNTDITNNSGSAYVCTCNVYYQLYLFMTQKNRLCCYVHKKLPVFIGFITLKSVACYISINLKVSMLLSPLLLLKCWTSCYVSMLFLFFTITSPCQNILIYHIESALISEHKKTIFGPITLLWVCTNIQKYKFYTYHSTIVCKITIFGALFLTYTAMLKHNTLKLRLINKAHIKA